MIFSVVILWKVHMNRDIVQQWVVLGLGFRLGIQMGCWYFLEGVPSTVFTFLSTNERYMLSNTKYSCSTYLKGYTLLIFNNGPIGSGKTYMSSLAHVHQNSNKATNKGLTNTCP